MSPLLVIYLIISTHCGSAISTCSIFGLWVPSRTLISSQDMCSLQTDISKFVPCNRLEAHQVSPPPYAPKFLGTDSKPIATQDKWYGSWMDGWILMVIELYTVDHKSE